MYRLFIGNKNYSSWSLRPWVLMKAHGIPFEEVLLPFHDDAAWAAYRLRMPSGLVPALQDGDRVVWESLAIAEYLAERHPGLWPEDRAARAFARSASAEMHAGFSALRDVCGMNVGIRVALHDAARRAVSSDLARIDALWSEGLARFGGPFLAGQGFSVVDAFFCPVAFRVQSYGLVLSAPAAAYCETLQAHPAMVEWYEAGLAEAFRDWPHEDEIATAGTVTEDLREPGRNERRTG